MKVTVLSLNEDTVKFIVDGIDTAFANALRRTMVSEVPTMAIEDIFYYDNTSVVPDEVLAHRIGMVPLKTDLEHYRLPSECDCKADLGDKQQYDPGHIEGCLDAHADHFAGLLERILVLPSQPKHDPGRHHRHRRQDDDRQHLV